MTFYAFIDKHAWSWVYENWRANICRHGLFTISRHWLIIDWWV